MIVWKIIIALVAAVLTAPFYHHVCLGWLYRKWHNERVEKIGHWVLIIVLTIVYFLVIQYGVDNGDREHYYPEQWEPAL